MKKIINSPVLEDLSQKVVDLAQSGVARSKQLAEIAKLRMNNLSEEDAMKKAYIEIGKLYYAEHGDAPDGAYVALCSRISQAQDNIQANLAQIADLKQTVSVSEEDYADDIVPEAEASAEEAPEEAAPAEEAAYEEAAPEEAVFTAEETPAEEEPIPDEE